MGEDYFYSHDEFSNLYDIEIPPFFAFEFGVFMELYNLSGDDGLRWEDIHAWELVRGERLSQFDVDIILKMNSWASQTISELRNKEE